MSAPVPPPSSAPPPASSSPSPSDGDDDEDAASSAGDGKKRSSYYFFKSTPAHEAHKYMPTLLTPSASADALPSSSSSAALPQPVAASPSPSPEPSGGSRWNAAGTWEEKDLSSWAQQRLTALLSFPASASSSSSLSVTVTGVTGDATLVFTRGKKRVGYDLSITAEWKAKAGSNGEEMKGGLELPSIDQTSEGEYEMVVTVKERGQAADDDVDAVTRQVRHLKPKLSERIKQFENELREQ